MKLCVFAGTFNPIHAAHLKMANYIINNFCVDKILFIPAHIPPHKNLKKDLCMHRFNMVKIATKCNPKFEVSDIEYKRNGKSYTFDTINELYKKYDIDEKINFVIGTDAFEKIETWYETEKLKQLIDFIVFIRENESVNFEELKVKGYNFKFAHMNFIDISSTKIRQYVRDGKSIKELVPEEIEEYIIKYGLYKD